MADLHFIGIGAARSGTSWLYNTLKEHPRISFGLQKELNFFNDTYASYSAHILQKNFTRGLDWYLRQLALEEDNDLPGLTFPINISLVNKYCTYHIVIGRK